MKKFNILLVFLVMGCSAMSDLDDIAQTKKECATFKKKYDEVGPKNTTLLINMTIDRCKTAGAW